MKDKVAVGQYNTVQEGKINLKHNSFQSQTHQQPDVCKQSAKHSGTKTPFSGQSVQSCCNNMEDEGASVFEPLPAFPGFC